MKTCRYDDPNCTGVHDTGEPMATVCPSAREAHRARNRRGNMSAERIARKCALETAWRDSNPLKIYHKNQRRQAEARLARIEGIDSGI